MRTSLISPAAHRHPRSEGIERRIIVVRLDPQRHVSCSYRYRVAGTELILDGEVAELSTFARGRGTALAHLGTSKVPAPGASMLLFHDRVQVGSREREIECRFGSSGYRLAVGDVGVFDIDVGGGSIVLLQEEGCEREAIAESLLGPALTLALALGSTFCLHASALLFSDGGGTIAFVGDSGAGKSTLAATLSEQQESSCTLLADDVLPLDLIDESIAIRARFPQLKLASDRQPSAAFLPELPLTGVLVLEAPSHGAAESDRISLRNLSSAEATLALVRHTIASRLFSEVLLRSHLELCIECGKRIPFATLSYPRRWEDLPKVHSRILGFAAEHAFSS